MRISNWINQLGKKIEYKTKYNKRVNNVQTLETVTKTLKQEYIINGDLKAKIFQL